MDGPPKKTRGDVAHSLARAGLSAIPFAGGAASELFTLVIAPPLEKRRDEWMASVADALKELEDKVEDFKLEDLSENETFITTVLHASQLALRNHQEEKIKALCNAVLNASLPNSPDEDLQPMFLSYVDDLTPWHLRILEFYLDPFPWMEKRGLKFPRMTRGATPLFLLDQAFRELVNQREFKVTIVRDLHARSLIAGDHNYAPVIENGLFIGLVTPHGRQFINFITSPLE